MPVISAPSFGPETRATLRLEDLDRSYAGSLDPLARHGARARSLRLWREALSSWPQPATAWPTLPVCAAARVDAILALLGDQRGPVLVAEDADGVVSSLIAAGVAAAAMAGAVPLGLARLVAVACAAPEQVAASLSLAREKLMPQGLIMLTARAIAVRTVLEVAAAAGDRLLTHQRRSQVFLVPGPFACDDAGDLFVIAPRAPGGSAADAPKETGPSALQPALALDVDGLAIVPNLERAMTLLAERIAAQAPHRAASLLVEPTTAGGGVLSFFDMAGYGCVAELRPDHRLLIDLLPYHPQLDYAVRTAIVATLGTPATRIRISDLPLARARDTKPDPKRHSSLAEPAPPDATPAPVRPCDGVVVVRRSGWVELHDWANDRRLEIDDATAAMLKASLLDPAPVAAPGALVSGAWLEQAPPRLDAKAHARLSRLDSERAGAELAHLDLTARAAYEAVLTAHAWRKHLVPALGQSAVLPETALRRALLIGNARASAVTGKQVVCLGDDDLVSVALAALGHEVLVLDFDADLLAFIRRIAERLSLRIDAEAYDVCRPLPSHLLGRFAAFVTDPMPNAACYALFLSRAMPMLAPGGLGYVSMHAPTASLFGELASTARIEVRRSWRQFNQYYGANFEPSAYDSDWLEVASSAKLRLPIAIGEGANGVGLYAEGYQPRPATLVDFFADIDIRSATLPHLHRLLDIVESEGIVALRQRHAIARPDAVALHGPTADGYLVLHADRTRRALRVLCRPRTDACERRLQRLMLETYKPEAREVEVYQGRTVVEQRFF